MNNTSKIDNKINIVIAKLPTGSPLVPPRAVFNVELSPKMNLVGDVRGGVHVRFFVFETETCAAETNYSKNGLP